MANTNTPFGFKPSRYVDGRPFNGAVNTYPIAYNYNTAMYIGDPVKIVSGKVNLAGVSDQIRGILIGVRWVASSGARVFGPYWAGTITTPGNQDAEAVVVDDPNVLFEASFTNSTSVPAQADAGQFFKHLAAAGTAATGLSAIGIDYTTKTATATSGVWRFVSFVPRVDNDTASAYSRGLFVPTLHDFRTTSGAA